MLWCVKVLIKIVVPLANVRPGIVLSSFRVNIQIVTSELWVMTVLAGVMFWICLHSVVFIL